MQSDEAAIRTGLGLAGAIREQYIHIAHTVIAADGSHVEHYHDWVQKVRAGTRALRGKVAETERWRLDRIEEISDEIDVVFRTIVLPASLSRDHARIAQVHQQLEERVTTAAGDADIVAQSVEARMSREHVGATRVTRAAASTAGIGVLILVALSMVSARNLRNAVLRPLGALADAASRIGSGDLTARVSVPAEGELGLLARAFDHMAAQLSQNQQRLIRSERMAAIGQLAAGVAHEINNPVGVIRGYLRTMIPEAEREQLKKELQILDEEAAACQRIAEDLVAYARAPELSPVNVDLGALVATTAQRFEESGETAGRELRVRADNAELSVDPVRLRQVLQNLLRNAIQASAASGVVDVMGEAADAGYTIRVLDRGGGVPDEIRSRLFEPFVSGRVNGTGLGLAVCSGIVQAHGGTIEARTRRGGGAEFVVELPRVLRKATEDHV
jgi:signal transduction histidine kinase